jgi:hypothetical protein
VHVPTVTFVLIPCACTNVTFAPVIPAWFDAVANLLRSAWVPGMSFIASNSMVLAAGYAMCLVHPGYVFKTRESKGEKILSDDETSIL